MFKFFHLKVVSQHFLHYQLQCCIMLNFTHIFMLTWSHIIFNRLNIWNCYFYKVTDFRQVKFLRNFLSGDRLNLTLKSKTRRQENGGQPNFSVSIDHSELRDSYHWRPSHIGKSGQVDWEKSGTHWGWSSSVNLSSRIIYYSTIVHTTYRPQGIHYTMQIIL